MAYAAQADLCPSYVSQDDLVGLTDDTNSGEVNAAVVSQHLETASGQIDTYCRGRYQTPLQQCDDVVALCCKIATFTLFGRRRNKTASESVGTQYNAAMQMLKDISTGKANLDLPEAATPQTPVVGPQVPCRPQVFDECNLKGFV